MHLHFPKYDRGDAYHWRETDRRSKNYNPPLVARYDAVVRRVRQGDVVLDVGCGDGYLTHLLAQKAKIVVGVDYEQNGVTLARTKLAGVTNCRLICGSCYQLGLRSGTFDTVVLADVIEHLEEDGRCVAELARLVSSSGQLLVTTPRWRPERGLRHFHVREYTAADLDALLRRHFGSVEVIGLWPLRWLRFFETRVGFRVVPMLGRCGFNPFFAEGADAHKFSQLLAICRGPLA